MAGKISINLARHQGAAKGCVDCDENDEEFATGIPGVMDRDLKQYWTRGKGALKIRWFTDGSFRRCVRLLRKYFPQNPQGLCANLHKAATGEWPAEKGIPS
jgi:hypothetical protein